MPAVMNKVSQQSTTLQTSDLAALTADLLLALLRQPQQDKACYNPETVRCAPCLIKSEVNPPFCTFSSGCIHAA